MREQHATRHAVDHRSAVTAAATRADLTGTYLTNGVFLYRVIDVVISESCEMAELEDCYGLDVVRVPMRDLLARRLRTVTPA